MIAAMSATDCSTVLPLLKVRAAAAAESLAPAALTAAAISLPSFEKSSLFATKSVSHNSSISAPAS